MQIPINSNHTNLRSLCLVISLPIPQSHQTDRSQSLIQYRIPEWVPKYIFCLDCTGNQAHLQKLCEQLIKKIALLPLFAYVCVVCITDTEIIFLTVREKTGVGQMQVFPALGNVIRNDGNYNTEQKPGDKQGDTAIVEREGVIVLEEEQRDHSFEDIIPEDIFIGV